MNNKTSVYDKENFFELYQKLRANPISLNEIVEKPTMLSLLPDLKGKKLLDLGCGFRIIIMTQANTQVNTIVLELLPKFKIKKMNRWCAV